MAVKFRFASLVPLALASASLVLPACSSDYHDDKLPDALPTTDDTITPQESRDLESVGLSAEDVELADLGEEEGEEGSEALPPEEDPPSDPPIEDDPPPEDPPVEEPDPDFPPEDEATTNAEAIIDEGEPDAEPSAKAPGTVSPLTAGARCSGSSLNCEIPLSHVRSLCPVKYQSNDDFWSGKNILKIAPKGSSYEKRIGQAEKRRFLTPGGGLFWPVASGTPVFDGFGQPIGNLATKTVQINYGARKTLHGRAHVLAFSATVNTPSPDFDGQRASYLKPSNGKVVTTGWIEQGRVSPAVACMPTLRKPVTVPKGVTKRPRLGTDTCEGLYARATPGCVEDAYAGKKTAANVTSSAANASDYLLNDGGVHNILWSTPLVGGSANDVIYASPTYAIEFASRSGGKVPVLRLRTYDKGSKTASGTMLYTYIRAKAPSGGQLFGWVSLPQVASAAPTGVEQGSACAGKAKGNTYCDATGQPFFCTSSGFISRGKACNPGSLCRTDPASEVGAAEVDEAGEAVCYKVE